MGLSGRWAYCKKASLNVNYSDRDGLSCTGKSDGGVGVEVGVEGGGGVEKACTCNKVIFRKIARENRGVRYVYFNYFILSDYILKTTKNVNK